MSKTVWWIIGGVGIVALAVALAVALVAEPEPPADEFGDVEVTGEALTIHDSSASTDPSIGSPAPSLSGADWNGEAVAVDTTNGNPKAVIFLAHWCPHCQREVPQLQAWLNQNDIGDVELIGVATSINPAATNYPPSTWLEGEGWTAPTMLDSEGQIAAISYGLRAFPYWVLIDSNGLVIDRFSGELPVEAYDTIFSSLANS